MNQKLFHYHIFMVDYLQQICPNQQKGCQEMVYLFFNTVRMQNSTSEWQKSLNTKAFLDNKDDQAGHEEYNICSVYI